MSDEGGEPPQGWLARWRAGAPARRARREEAQRRKDARLALRDERRRLAEERRLVSARRKLRRDQEREAEEERRYVSAESREDCDLRRASGRTVRVRGSSRARRHRRRHPRR